jgi:Zn-dependent metalloprotease
VKILKQGVCLALLGGALAAAPVTVAASATPAATAASSAAPDQGLVQGMRDTARGQITLSKQSATGAVGFARAAQGGDLLPGTAGDSKAAAAAKADKYLASYGGAFGAGKGELTRTSVTADQAGGFTASYTQSFKGVPVFGGLIKAHVNGAGALSSVNGFAAPDLSLSTTPAKSSDQASARAVEFVKSSPSSAGNGAEAQANGLKATSTELVVYREGLVRGVTGKTSLVYVVEVGDGAGIRERVFVDANSGKIVNRYSMIDNDLNRELYETSNTPANLVWKEGDAFPGALNQDQQNLVVSSGESYWFFENGFDRDSYDGNGALRKTVNNDPTIACPNANWNGVTTNYCDGVTSDDVVSHEWGHAYTEYTSGLIYQWQSGALNESYSDVWGETLDLINAREDEDEGDLDAKRPVGLCSTHSGANPIVHINSPAAAVKDCEAGAAQFGPQLTGTGITKDVIVGLDPDEDGAGTASTTDACSALTNGAAVTGKIALVDRGSCGFAIKVKNAQNAGAVAVLVADNVESSPGGMSGTDPTITIPSVRIRLSDGNIIKNALATSAVNVTMKDASGDRVDSYRWLIGEKSDAFGGAIRDMWVPTCYGDPGKVSDAEYKCSTDDQGGVHGNSGVANHAYALLVDGGTYNGITVQGIGLTKAAHIWFQAQTNYLTPVSGFPEMADAIEASCADLVNHQLSNLSTVPNDRSTYSKKITAADCAQVALTSQAVEFRTPATQCDFRPLLNPNTPAVCGAGTGSKSAYSETFESGLDGWSTAGGGPAFPGGLQDPWKSTTDLPSGNKPAGSTSAAFGPTPSKGECSGAAGDYSSVNYLTSPDIVVGSAGDVAGSARLTFDHNVETELGYDGGTVQISKNGGAFTTVPSAAYAFNPPSTLATAAAGNTNPLQGQPGFTGTDGGKIESDWGTSIINLTTAGVALGDTVKVRFAIGRDGCGGVFGWWVDNVKVSTCKVVATPTVVATHDPEPSTFGTASSVKVTVSGSAGTPTGTVTVKEGATTIGSGPLDGTGKATVALPASLSVGAHALTVSYSGDVNYDVKTANVTANVKAATPAVSATTTTASADPKRVGKGKSFKALVAVTSPGGTPAGAVQIVLGTKVLGTGTLGADGKVTITITKKMAKKLKPGKNTLTARYAGNSAFTASQASFVVTLKRR